MVPKYIIYFRGMRPCISPRGTFWISFLDLPFLGQSQEMHNLPSNFKVLLPLARKCLTTSI